MNPGTRALAALASAALLAACGGGDGGSAADTKNRTVKIAMRDIAFSPSAVTVARGEKVTFVFTNEGKIAHDAFIGDQAAQDEHESETRGRGDKDHGEHSEGADAITVQPGKTGKITQTFDDAGATEIGCHRAGHYAAGMKVAITITP